MAINRTKLMAGQPQARPFATGNISGTGSTVPDDPENFLGGTFRGPRMVALYGPVTEIQFLFSNHNPNSTPGLSPITIGCTIEVGSNQATSLKYPLTFNGRLTYTLDPGGQIWSDPVNLDVKAGAEIFPRTFVTVGALNVGIGASFITFLAGEGMDYAASNPPDKRDTGTITVVANRSAYGPKCAKGVQSGSRLPCIGLIGDSIILGTGDTASFRGGWALRGINDRVPTVQASRSGAASSGSQLIFRGRQHLNLCDHVVMGYGVNDISGSTTVAQLQAMWIVAWKSIRAMGPQVWQATIVPVTTSTDGWVTVANQAVAAYNPKRTEVNDWLRDGAPIAVVTQTPLATGTVNALRAGSDNHPLTGYLDLADTIESARNSGLWKAGHTTDGTHPSAVGHAAGSAAISDLTQFGYGYPLF